VLHTCIVNINSEDVTRIIDIEGVRGCSARVVEGSELTVFKKEAMVYVIGINISTGNLARRVDSSRACKNRSWIINLLEAASVQEKAMSKASAGAK